MNPSLTFTLIATERGPAFHVAASDDHLPPIIALAFGRALVAASEVFLVASQADQGDEEQTPNADLPVYPRGPKVL